MSSRVGIFSASALSLALVIAGMAYSPVAQAGSISYGNSPVIPPGVMFVNVTESSGTDGVPLYGPPAYFPTGIDFDPVNFIASSTGGGADLTDGQLNYTIMSTNGQGIPIVNYSESGVYTLSGIGTAATQAFAGAIVRASITEVNGVAVAPIVLAPAFASVSYNLAANAGVNSPWSLGLSVNVAAALGAGQNATKVDVVVNNALVAISEPGTVASISKGDFTTNTLPEPSAILMAAVGLCGLGLATVRRSA